MCFRFHVLGYGVRFAGAGARLNYDGFALVENFLGQPFGDAGVAEANLFNIVNVTGCGVVGLPLLSEVPF